MWFGCSRGAQPPSAAPRRPPHPHCASHPPPVPACLRPPLGAFFSTDLQLARRSADAISPGTRQDVSKNVSFRNIFPAGRAPRWKRAVPVLDVVLVIIDGFRCFETKHKPHGRVTNVFRFWGGSRTASGGAAGSARSSPTSSAARGGGGEGARVGTSGPPRRDSSPHVRPNSGRPCGDDPLIPLFCPEYGHRSLHDSADCTRTGSASPGGCAGRADHAGDGQGRRRSGEFRGS